ncbi:MAG: transcriptional regulator [Betaproteobacteria bacterium RIFCSPLOWO2_02_FULL_62_17]|nr:MAG: transcriptional regulator [Betaproteobacteria bacterium RIFCSPLOWO2_02_FULL_62_17]
MGNRKPISISDVLFSGVQQRVLRILFGQPDRSFYTNEIAKLGKTGRGSLQRELERMTAAGLITMTVIGRQKHYQANRDSFVFNEIRSITQKSFGLADVLRKALSSCGAAIRYAFIYGSVARGTDTAASDIDVMVVGEGLSYSGIYEVLTKAEESLGRKVSPTLYSPKEWNKRRHDDNAFITRVLDQPKIFLIGRENDIPAGKSRESVQDRQAQI